MSKRAIIIVAVLSLVAVGCSGGSEAVLSLGKGARFVPQVVDALTNVGMSPSITLDSSGEPAISYLGFNSVPEEGEIPEARAIDKPLVPGVFMAHAAAGRWSLAPITELDEALVDEGSDGKQTPVPNASTAATTDPQGIVHVAWIDKQGVNYSAEAGGRFAPEVVTKGGNISGLSIAADDGGGVWVSYLKNGAVVSAANIGGAWAEEVAAKTAPCGKDCGNSRTATTTLDGQPVIAFTDGRGATVAAFDGTTWNTEALPGGGGLALGASSTKDGPLVSYVSSDGQVTVAEYLGSSWKTETAGTTTVDPSPMLTTGVAEDADGVRYATWYDSKSDSIKLAVNGGAGYKMVSTPETGGGAMPSIVAAEAGAWIAWYDHVNENLQAGFYGEQDPALAVAAPEVAAPVVPAAPASPAAPTSTEPTGPTEPPAGGGGGASKAVTLTIESPAGSVATGFDKTTLSAPADTPIQIQFKNSDPGVPHNVEILTADPLQDPTAESLFNGETITGPADITYDVPPLEPGKYFYRCIVHPTTMTGTLTVK